MQQHKLITQKSRLRKEYINNYKVIGLGKKDKGNNEVVGFTLRKRIERT
jgi:hypothetical protein